MLRALLEATDPSSPPVVHELALGPFPARVVVDGAVVRAASAGPFSGDDALFRLLLCRRRGLRSQPATAHNGAAITSEIGGARDLLERFDAWQRDLERQSTRAGGFARVWAVRFLALKAVLAGVPEDVKRVVRLLDGTRDLRTLLAESPLPAPLTLRVVERLLQQGALERADLDVDDVPQRTAAGDSGPNQVDDVERAPRTGDRSWLEERAARPRTTTATAATAPSTTTTTTTTMTTTTPPSLTTAPSTTAPPAQVSTPPRAAEAEPVVLERRRDAAVQVAGTSTLPQALPKPAPELTTWLGPEDDFFAGRATAQTLSTTTTTKQAWPPWTLAALVVGGAVIGALVARALLD